VASSRRHVYRTENRLNHTIEKFFEPITQQKTYKVALTQSMADVRKNALRVREEAQQCSAARTANMDRKTDYILGNVEDISQMLYRLLGSNPLLVSRDQGKSALFCSTIIRNH
jgi:hypothetical protein